MRKKKRKRREMQKTNYKSHESKVLSVKILRVLPPVILIIGIMIPEHYKICSLPNQNIDLVIADVNKVPLIFTFVCLFECGRSNAWHQVTNAIFASQASLTLGAGGGGVAQVLPLEKLLAACTLHWLVYQSEPPVVLVLKIASRWLKKILREAAVLYKKISSSYDKVTVGKALWKQVIISKGMFARGVLLFLVVLQ